MKRWHFIHLPDKSTVRQEMLEIICYTSDLLGLQCFSCKCVRTWWVRTVYHFADAVSEARSITNLHHHSHCCLAPEILRMIYEFLLTNFSLLTSGRCWFVLREKYFWLVADKSVSSLEGKCRSIIQNKWIMSSSSLFVWLVADGWCWFVLREKYYLLVADGWFAVREKYRWLVVDKPSEQVPRLS
jgi:hypothetical protein